MRNIGTDGTYSGQNEKKLEDLQDIQDFDVNKINKGNDAGQKLVVKGFLRLFSESNDFINGYKDSDGRSRLLISESDIIDIVAAHLIGEVRPADAILKQNVEHFVEIFIRTSRLGNSPILRPITIEIPNANGTSSVKGNYFTVNDILNLLIGISKYNNFLGNEIIEGNYITKSNGKALSNFTAFLNLNTFHSSPLSQPDSLAELEIILSGVRLEKVIDLIKETNKGL